MNIENGAQLERYLRDYGYIAPDALLRMTTLKGGVSNRTVLVEGTAGAGFVVKQALNKLRVKEDWFSDPSRIHREAEGIRLLNRLAPAGPGVRRF